VSAAYHSSHALFFASTSETQGLVIAEAMAAGLPVVAVDDLAIADAVTDGVNGFLVPGDATSLAQAADRVLADDELRCRMADESRRRADDLCIDNQARRLVEIYEKALAAKPEPRRVGERRRAVTKRVRRQLETLRTRGGRLVRRTVRSRS
jgi:1,2-diacylglycerol 3-alpha-glucosyltransferase